MCCIPEMAHDIKSILFYRLVIKMKVRRRHYLKICIRCQRMFLIEYLKLFFAIVIPPGNEATIIKSINTINTAISLFLRGNSGKKL